MKKITKKENKKKRPERASKVYDCCWYGPYEHSLCCGGFCAIPWGR